MIKKQLHIALMVWKTRVTKFPAIYSLIKHEDNDEEAELEATI